MELKLAPIAWARQCSYKEKFGTPRQGILNPHSKAFIELSPQLPTGVTAGLEGFSHLWLLWWFHANTNQKVKGKVHAPRLDGKTQGVFATRSPHRPNPIGLSLVKRETLEPNGIWVSGVDFLEDTPILDIKPYIAEDRLEGSEQGWLQQLPQNTRAIRWAIDLDECLKAKTPEQRESFRNLVEATLQLDPRPVVYKRLEEEQGYRGPYGVRIEDYNLKFYSDALGFEVIELTSVNSQSDPIHQPT